jgi:hypothetical protein
MTTIIETERLILRTWIKEDAEAYFQINQDPKVIEFLRGPLTMEQVNDFIPAVNSHGDKHGYTLWAACLKETGKLIGFIGLNYTDGNRILLLQLKLVALRSQYWGKASTRRQLWNMALNSRPSRNRFFYGTCECSIFKSHGKDRIQRDVNGDFAHPKLAADHPLSSIFYIV